MDSRKETTLLQGSVVVGRQASQAATGVIIHSLTNTPTLHNQEVMETDAPNE